jgi:hypothetical protein
LISVRSDIGRQQGISKSTRLAELEAAWPTQGATALRRQNPSLAPRSKVADLRFEDSQNLANGNQSDLQLLWQAAVKHELDQLAKRLLDANRPIGQPNKITTIFGRKVTKCYKGKLQTIIEDLHPPNPVIRTHYAKGFLKQYVRDHLCLRAEPATNDVTDYGEKRAAKWKLKSRPQGL